MKNKNDITDFEVLNEIYNTKVPCPPGAAGQPLGVMQGGETIVIVKKEEAPQSRGNFAIKNEELGLSVMIKTGEGREVALILSSVEGNTITIKNTSDVIAKFLNQLTMGVNDLSQMAEPLEDKSMSCGGI